MGEKGGGGGGRRGWGKEEGGEKGGGGGGGGGKAKVEVGKEGDWRVGGWKGVGGGGGGGEGGWRKEWEKSKNMCGEGTKEHRKKKKGGRGAGVEEQSLLALHVIWPHPLPQHLEKVQPLGDVHVGTILCAYFGLGVEMKF